MSTFLPPEDPLLSLAAAEVPIEDIQNPEIQSLIDHMLTIAQGNQIDLGNGVMVGLAAPQIGVFKQVILVDTSAGEDRKNLGNLMAYINPQITWYSDEIVLGTEGCYSVDEHLDGKIPRAHSIRVIAYDREGNRIDQIFSGFIARIFQHEVDHLNGIRFPDRVGEEGILHWIPDGHYQRYLKEWKDWPLLFPWECWLKMKQGESYTPFQN